MVEQEKADLLCRVDFPLYSASMVHIHCSVSKPSVFWIWKDPFFTEPVLDFKSSDTNCLIDTNPYQKKIHSFHNKPSKE